MNKGKILKACLSLGGALLMGMATWINNKAADESMKEEVAKAVGKALADQAKES